jgi:hypothetical protein
MAVCWVCEREMSDRRVISCDAQARRREVPMFIGDETYEPVPFAIDLSVERCWECGALKGQIHHFGCFQEKCPECGGQFISCGCFDECYQHLCDPDDDRAEWHFGE